jgi:hypothetical protein
MSSSWLDVLAAVHIDAKAPAEQGVFGCFMCVELPTELVKFSSQGNLLLHRLIAVQCLSDQPVQIGKELWMLGFNATGFCRQRRAARHGLIETAAAFLLGEVLRQFIAYLTENPHDIGSSRVPNWSAAGNDGGPRLTQHPVEAPMVAKELAKSR